MSSTGKTSSSEADVLWVPPGDVREHSRLGHYLGWLEENKGPEVRRLPALWEWSVTDLDAFWTTMWEYFEVGPPASGSPALAERPMPGARWFPDATLNYAAHMLREAGDDDEVAVLARSQTRGPVDLTAGELRRQVARAGPGWPASASAGATGWWPTCPTSPRRWSPSWPPPASGAVWASCAPEFGTRSVLDRFTQIDPKVLLAVDGYRYGTKAIDRTGRSGRHPGRPPRAGRHRGRPLPRR